jgi:hypothetical protein
MAKGYAGLKRELDKVFSEWVRRRAAGPSGLVACVSCGEVKHWKSQQAGHFITRIRLGTRWEPRNVNPQCARCNVMSGNVGGYARWLGTRYGMEVFDLLDAQSRTMVKYNRAELQERIDYYKAQLKCLPQTISR